MSGRWRKGTKCTRYTQDVGLFVDLKTGISCFNEDVPKFPGHYFQEYPSVTASERN